MVNATSDSFNSSITMGDTPEETRKRVEQTYGRSLDAYVLNGQRVGGMLRRALCGWPKNSWNAPVGWSDAILNLIRKNVPEEARTEPGRTLANSGNDTEGHRKYDNWCESKGLNGQRARAAAAAAKQKTGASFAHRPVPAAGFVVHPCW
jgi:hypothetical protein